MNIEINIDEIIKSERFKDILTERLATKVANDYHYHDAEGYMIKDAIRNIIDKEAREIVKDYSKNYYSSNSSIKEMIEEEIEKLSKNEIIELLKDKFKD